MIDLHFWTTPNGYKPLLFLEEVEAAYNLVPVNLGQNEQFAPEFLKIAPNNRIPALVDREPKEGTDPISIFESGAILLYLADKTGRFLPGDPVGRNEALQWLFWQMGGLGPMAGQYFHFKFSAPEQLPYALERYRKETSRLYGVLDKRLNGRDYIAGGYSIADMASYPWVVSHQGLDQDLDNYPNIKRWFHTIAERPATVRAYEKGRAINPPAVNT